MKLNEKRDLFLRFYMGESQKSLESYYGISNRTVRRVLEYGRKLHEQTNIVRIFPIGIKNTIKNTDSELDSYEIIINFIGGSGYNKTVEINKDSKHFSKAEEILSLGGYGYRSLNLFRLIAKDYFRTNIISNYCDGKIAINEDKLFYNGNEIRMGLVDRIIDGYNNNRNVDHLIKFLDKLMTNPDVKNHSRLYDFLEHNDIVIDDDGDIITYKSVTRDYKDHHTNTICNKVGSNPKMDRLKVDSNDENTCSSGLHVCAKHYIADSLWLHNSRVVLCKVNPKDVVSIPVDYNNSKMRVCEYLVIDEVEDLNEI